MHERPRKPEYSAARVIKASRVLSWGEKAVWLEDYGLDQTLDGSYLPGPELGTRLALTGDTVDKYRQVLRRVELYESAPRQGRYTRSWYPVFPAGLPPRSPRMTPIELETCRAAFDAQVAQVLKRAHLLSPPDERSAISERIFHNEGRNVPATGRRPVREGGQGGEPPTSNVRSTYLPPSGVIQEPEAGAGANAPTAEDGEGPRSQDQRPADEVSAEGLATIRRQVRASLDGAEGAA